MKEPRIKLTPAGYCVNPSCGRQLYLELMRAPDDEACYECNPLPEGTRAPLVLLQGGGDKKTEKAKSGLPKLENPIRAAEQAARLAAYSRIDKQMLHGHCTEACCGSSENQWLHMLPLIADRVTCVTCGDAQPASSMTRIRSKYKCRACVNLCAMDCTNPFCPGCLPF